MSSYKNIRASRQRKDSHFSYSSERMTRLTSTELAEAPLQAKQGGASSLLSVKPSQDPVERTLGAEGGGEGGESAQSSLSSDLQINTEALSKLQVTQMIIS